MDAVGVVDSIIIYRYCQGLFIIGHCVLTLMHFRLPLIIYTSKGQMQNEICPVSQREFHFSITEEYRF